MKYFIQNLLDKFDIYFGWFLTNGRKQEEWIEKLSSKHPDRQISRVVVTGGAGFIGSHVVRKLIRQGIDVVVLDSLTYAGDMKNISDCKIEAHWNVDISDMKKLKSAFKNQKFDAILHLAAESHVDRSIEDPMSFVRTNVNGTCNLLEIAVQQHKENPDFIFYHISTDEVFGTLPLKGNHKFSEATPYDPRSPYSASKASSDHFVRAYHHTYNLPVVISNCSNNYGTHQYPEKLIPVVINCLIERKPIPVYGKGINKRDWLNVRDHANAIYRILKNGRSGETYCVGGNNVMSNIDLIETICHNFDEMYGYEDSTYLITHVEDRKGHDLKYAIDASKMKYLLGWEPQTDFEPGIVETIQWYVEKDGRIS